MKPGDKLTAEELNSLLNSWPEGSQGHDNERAIIAALDAIGAGVGYGALHQLAGFLYNVQCHGDPSLAAAMKRSRFKSLGWELPEDFETVARK